MKILDRCKATLIVLMMLTADLLPVAVKSQTTAPVRPLVIQGGTLIDATGRPPLQDAVIVIDGERVERRRSRDLVGGACREASERFCSVARQRGLDVLDLHPVFEGVPGTYLNLDGHWSDAGVELAAKTIVTHLNEPRENW